MGHTPYGYRIENGKVVIDEGKAAQVKIVFQEYLSGAALCASAAKAGMSMTHSSVKHMLTNSRYMGNEFYPAIIDEETFQKASRQLEIRAASLGRDSKGPKERIKPSVPKAFRIRPADRHFEDPFEQAAYLYSRIEEVKDGAG